MARGWGWGWGWGCGYSDHVRHRHLISPVRCLKLLLILNEPIYLRGGLSDAVVDIGVPVDPGCGHGAEHGVIKQGDHAHDTTKHHSTVIIHQYKVLLREVLTGVAQERNLNVQHLTA